jgi:hypothetical protein
MGRKLLYINTGRGVTDPLTGAVFSVTEDGLAGFADMSCGA